MDKKKIAFITKLIVVLIINICLIGAALQACNNNNKTPQPKPQGQFEVLTNIISPVRPENYP